MFPDFFHRATQSCIQPATLVELSHARSWAGPEGTEIGKTQSCFPASSGFNREAQEFDWKEGYSPEAVFLFSLFLQIISGALMGEVMQEFFYFIS